MDIALTPGLKKSFINQVITGVSYASNEVVRDARARASLFDLAALVDFLADHLKRKINVIITAGLAPDTRDRVLGQAQTVF